MKTTRIYKLNKPDYSDPIDVEELTENFDVIDYALEATQVKKTRTSNTISEKCILPYYRIRNNNDFDVTVTDRNFSVDYVIEAGKSKRFDVDGTNTDMNFYVQGLHDVEFEWFVSVADAIAEGGGGGGTGGTKNYNELINQPKINGVLLTGDVALTTLGIKGAAAKDVDTTGTAVTSESANVPTSAAVNAFVGSEIAKLGKPMEFKGKFSKAADVPDLSDTKEGWTYKVAVAGTYAGQKAKVGDAFISTGTAWEYFPSGDDEFSGENLLMTEYTKGSAKPESTDVSDTDTLNEAVQKIEWVLADKVDKDTTVNGKKLNANIVLSGSDEKLNATSYTKDDEVKDITKDSKIDEAVAQLEYRVDNKVNKTSVSSGENSTTSVINVTDAKAQMAMVASIKGKTQKVVQLINDRKTWTNGSNVDTRTQFMPMIYVRENVSTANIGWIMQEITTATGLFQSKIKATYSGGAILLKHNGASKDINIVTNEAKITSGHSYIFSCNIKSCNPTAANGLSLENVMLFDITEMRLSDSTTLEQFNAIIKEYVPYGSYLWNAPVESVVSQSMNLWDERWEKGVYTPEAGQPAVNDAVIRSSSYIEIKPNTHYTLNKNGRFSYYNENKTFVGTLAGDGTKTSGVSPSNAKYLRFNLSTQYGNIYNHDVILSASSDVKTYKPYNKTTVLVPSAVKNLPDYGCSIGTIAQNIVDFENGVYYHNVGHIDLGSLTWTRQGSSSTYYNSNAISGIKKVATRNTKIMSAVYTELYNSESTVPDKSIFVTSGGEISINDSAFGGAASLKGKYLTYELASPETIPLSDYLRPLPVENGGTLTLVNEHNHDMPSVIKYKKEVN